MEVLIAVITCLLAFLVLRGFFGTGKKPPGPWGLPIIGYIPFITRKPYLKLQRLAKKYGNVFSVRLGNQYIVVLDDYQSAKEAFAQDVFIGRPPEFGFQTTEVTKQTNATLGMPWKKQRRFALHQLRDLGFGKSKIEGLIQEEITDLLVQMGNYEGKPLQIRKLIVPSTLNNILALMFGRRFKHNDPILQMLIQSMDFSGADAVIIILTFLFPWLNKLIMALNIGGINKITRSTQIIKDFIRQEIKEHEKTLNPEIIRDFVDGYLLEIRKMKDDPAFHKDVLEDIVGIFFGAGSESVRSSVEWLILMVAHNQDSQHKIQTEIDEVIGRERPPIWPDLKDMPYTDAFMREMQRWMTLAPLNLAKYTLADVELNGYLIPKHTRILHNMWSTHHNKEYWGEDADEFRAERFLTEDGKAVKKFDHFIPFSTGKRACPGEPLAKAEVFLYFTSIMQKFDIRFPDGKVANFDGDLGIVLMPKLQEIILAKRS